MYIVSHIKITYNGDVGVTMLSSSVVSHGLEPQSDQTKDY